MHQIALLALSALIHIRLATDTKIFGVSVGVGVEISTPKKVGVGVGVEILTPKIVVSVSVSEKPTPKNVGVGGKTNPKLRIWPLLDPDPWPH
jgi:hypothetical protein